MNRLLKSAAIGFAFALVCAIVTAGILTALVYFEVMGVTAASKFSYGAFVLILFTSSFIIAKKIGSRGLFVGLGIAACIILLGSMHRAIGIEGAFGLQFIIRAAITTLVAAGGAVTGVNTIK